jgi:hypothetical protein
MWTLLFLPHDVLFSIDNWERGELQSLGFVDNIIFEDYKFAVSQFYDRGKNLV